MKSIKGGKKKKKYKSLPTRECGLKSLGIIRSGQVTWSLPTRECGLKFPDSFAMAYAVSVTPYAGVWIEIEKGKKGI